MDIDRWRQIEAIYLAACELDEPARDQFIHQQCHGDPSLEHDVTALLTGADFSSAAGDLKATLPAHQHHHHQSSIAQETDHFEEFAHEAPEYDLSSDELEDHARALTMLRGGATETIVDVKPSHRSSVGGIHLKRTQVIMLAGAAAALMIIAAVACVIAIVATRAVNRMELQVQQSLLKSQTLAPTQGLPVQPPVKEESAGDQTREAPDVPAAHPVQLPAGLLTDLGQLAAAHGSDERAIGPLTQLLEYTRAEAGDEHPTTLQCIHQLAEVHLRAGRHEEAAALFREAMELRRRVLGEHDAQTLQSMAGLGAAHCAALQFDQARSWLEEALRLGRAHLPATDITLAIILMRLGELQFATGRFEDAHFTLLEAHESLLENADPAAGALIDAVRDDLIRLYQRWNKPNEAERWKAIKARDRGENSAVSNPAPQPPHPNP